VTLFRKRGYEHTRVQDIVQRSHISEATFFNYFPSKDALLREFALAQLDFSIAAVRAQLDNRERSVPDRIRALMEVWARSSDADREFYAMVANRSRMLSGPQGALREKSMLLYAGYEELISEGQRRGEIRNDSPPLQLAEMLEGVVTIIAGNWLVGWWQNRTESLEERFANAVNVFLDGCAPARAVPRSSGTSRVVHRRPRRAGRRVRRS
jgi:AcrR family transcriptional regulator